MIKLMALMGVALVLSSILFFMGEILNMKYQKESAKLSPFECGFDSLSWHRKPFSVHFFFTCIVFLIFDVELLIILPWLTGKHTGGCQGAPGAVLVLLLAIFMGGLLLEWNTKGLDWKS